MKYKVFNITLFGVKIFFFLFLIVLSILTTIASFSNIFMSIKVKEFIENATFEEQIGNVRYYYIECDDIEVDSIIKENPYYGSNYPALGNPGDIFIMPQSRMEYFPLFAPFITYTFGGHAGIIAEEDRLIEAMGGTPEEGFVFLNISDLFIEERTVIGLRVDVSAEERAQALENAYDKIGDEYNYLFIFNTKDKYYCMDICSRIYEEVSKESKVDKTSFFTTVQELFNSKKTKISFIKYYQDGITYVYYLKAVNK